MEIKFFYISFEKGYGSFHDENINFFFYNLKSVYNSKSYKISVHLKNLYKCIIISNIYIYIYMYVCIIIINNVALSLSYD